MSKSPVPRLPRLETAPLVSAASLMALEARYVFDASLGDLFDGDDRDAERHTDRIKFAHPEPRREADTEAQAAPPPPRAPSRDIVFVDAGLPDLAVFLAAVPKDAEIILVDRHESFATKAMTALAGRSDVGAIHIVAHGSEGQIAIGTDGIDPLASGAATNVGLLAIGRALSAEGDLLIYGCDFAAGETGQRAAAALARITGADVAASVDESGGGTTAGDFDLEYRVGRVDTAAIAADDWNHLLAAPIVVSPLPNVTYNDGQTIVIDTAPSFQDPDGHTMTYTVSGLPPGLAINATTGRIVGTLPSDASHGGPYVVTVRATDSTGAFVETSFTITVNNVPPLRNGDIGNRTNADGTNIGTFEAGVFFRDGSPDFDALTFSATGLPPGLTLNTATGAISGTIATNASQFNGGVYTVTITATDASGALVSQTFTWTITNLPVLGTVPTQNWTDGQTVTFDLDDYIRDTTPDGDPVTITVLNPSNLPPGLTFDPTTNRITGTLSAAASAGGPYVIQFTATDGQGSTITRSFTINVTNSAPTSDPIPGQSWVEGNTILFNLAAYFRDGGLDSDALTYAVTGLPAGLTFNPTTGQITGTLAVGAKNGGVNGVYSITVTVTDEQGATHSRSFLLTVVNDPPVVVGPPPNVSANDGQTISIDLSGYFTDPDGDALSFSATGLPPGLAIDPVTGRITGTLSSAASQQSPYMITVRATDPAGQSVTVQFTLTATNQPVDLVNPIPDQVGVDGQTISISLAAFFADRGPDGDQLRFTATGLPPGLTLNPLTGVISGRLAAGASALGPFSITISVTDDQGSTVTDTFTFTVSNPPPTANPDTLTIDEDVSVIIDVLGNDVDPDGDILTVIQATATVGTVTILPDGRISYTPPANYYGPAVITYTIRDANGATSQSTVTITINPVDDAPTAITPPNVTGTDGETISIRLADYFADPDGGTLTFSITGLPPGLSFNATTGMLTGTLSALASAQSPYQLTVTATDSSGATVSTSFSLIVTNPPPQLISPLPHHTAQDGNAVMIDLTGFFRDGGFDTDALTLSVQGLPPGLSFNPLTGRITGLLPNDASGAYTITVRATDAQGAFTTSTFTLTVVNPPPRVDVIAVEMDEDGNLILDPLGAATDPDGDLLRLVDLAASIGSVTRLPDGRILFVPPANFNGMAEIAYRIVDADGASAAGLIRITVNPVNDGPSVVTPPGPKTAEDFDDILWALGGAFTDIDGDALRFSATGLPAGLSIDPTTGQITGRLARDASTLNGGVYTIMVTARDASGASSHVIFTLTVTNPAPTVTDGTGTVTGGETLTLDALARAADRDGDALRLLSASVDQGSVTIGADGRIVYTPPAGMSGTAIVTFQVIDADGAVVTGRFVVTVQPAPVVDTGRPRETPADNAGRDPIASGVVLTAVNGAADLGGVAGFGPAHEPLLLATTLDRAAPLSALATDSRPDAVTPRLAWSRERIDWPLDEADAASPTATDARLILEATVMIDRILIDILVSDPDAVFEVVVQGRDGAPLPPFVRALADGRVQIDRQAPGTSVTLELVALRADGQLIVKTVMLDAGTGQIDRAPTKAAPFAEALRKAAGTR
jgi:hypothetical protein